MKVSVHLRPTDTASNKRSECIADGLRALGHDVVVMGKGERSNADLVIQTAFARSNAVMSAIDRGVPYLVMEAGPFRPWTDIHTTSSFNYNGLAGGAFRPPPLEAPRWHPEPQPWKTEGGTIIIGQKPTDKSLRGVDYVEWLQDVTARYPEAEFRHHPLMVLETRETIHEALERNKRCVVYTSTTAVDASVQGLEVIVEGPGCWWDPAKDRDEQLRELSYAAFQHGEYRTKEVAAYVMSGYDEARARAEAGLYEIPRGKVDGVEICNRYYQLGLPSRAQVVSREQ